MGPGSRKHCWGRDGPIEGWSRTAGSQRGVVGEVVVKPNTAGGSVSPSKSGPESVYYYLAVQYSWSIHSPRDQEPKPTRVVGRPKGWVGFFLPKVEVGLKSRNNGLSGPTGVVPTLGGLQ